MPTVLKGVFVFVAVYAVSPGFSKGSRADGRREEGAPEGGVVGLKRGTNSDTSA